MTNPRAIRDRQHAIGILTQLLNIRLNPTLTHLTDQLDQLDGYPTTASGTDHQPRGTNTLTPTEAAASARLGDLEARTRYRPGPSIILDDLNEYLVMAHTGITRALDLCEQHAPNTVTATDLDRLRCIGTGNAEGATCTQWAVKAGRCIDCAETWRLAERAHTRRLRYHETPKSA